jgi:hypothetical protein
MGQPLAGPGIFLPPPQNYYPSELQNAPQDPSSNAMTLNAGDTFVVPAGNYYADLAGPIITQFLDPVNQIWNLPRTAPDGFEVIRSDGYNVRLANLTGCLVAAVVTNQGSGYSQATATCVASAGGSTWQPIVGGQLSLSTISVAGGNYGVPPILMIPPPPYPGVQATGYTTITSGTVSGVTLDNVGAGYLSTPTVVVVPSPFDPNLAAGITQASVVLTRIGTGSISAILCLNPGASVATSGVSLTIAGAGGSGATATAVQMLEMVGGTSVAAGAGFTSGVAGFSTIGGIPTATAVVTNPLIEGRAFVPRPAQALLAMVGGSFTSVSAIYDGGLFLGTPSSIISQSGGAIPTTAASVTATLGAGPGTFRLQPAP